jgi:hypothetical protein
MIPVNRSSYLHPSIVSNGPVSGFSDMTVPLEAVLGHIVVSVVSMGV